MLTFFKDWIVNATLWDTTLIALVIFICVFFLLSVLLSAYTLTLRLITMKRKQRWSQLEARWENLLLEILSGAGSAEEIHGLVKPKDRLYFVDFLQRYARLMRGYEIQILKELARPYLSGIKKHLKAADAERRARAIQTLSVLGLEDYVDDILNALSDPSPLAAMIAARSLASKDHPEFIKPVLETLYRFDNWSQTYLTSMLVSVGAKIIPDLRDTLSDSNTPDEVRAVVCDALKDLNDFASADIANSILETKRSRELIASCLRLLARTGRPEHLPNIRALIHSEDDVIRIQAIRALGQIGDAEDRPPLAQAILDASPWVALQAARGLLETGGLSELRSIADSDHERAVLAAQVLKGGI